jgi:hypothetical protein
VFALSRRKNPDSDLGRIREYFKFDIIKETNSEEWKVTVLDVNPITQIKPLGSLNLAAFGKFGENGDSVNDREPS